VHTDEYAKMRALEDHYWWFVSRRRMARSLLARYAPDAKRILDLGCGTGAFMGELPSGIESTGLDFSDQAVAFCRKRGLESIVQGDAQSVPFQNAVFDAVVSLDTLEHVADDDAAAKEVARILRPGGVLVMNVPAYRWLWGPHDVALMHHRRYTRSQVCRLLENAGLRVEKSSYNVFFLFPVVVLMRIVEKFRRGPAEVRLPSVPGPFNRALVILQDIETRLVLGAALPWGSSVVAVARKVN
jgi:ubiquinone/menaquinone biosynthesis C-methylase UbiE